MDVSVIIVNYNTHEMTSKCIESVIDNTKDLSYEIILVDNASGDGSKEFFEQDKRITYIYSNTNLGFGRANNLGVSKAKGNYLFFLNPDTILIGNPIHTLFSLIKQNSFYGAIGGNLLDANLKPTISYKRFLPGLLWELNNLSFTIIERILFGKSYQYNHTNKDIKVGYITGADLMIPQKIFQEVGGFDERFFLYYEETDLCLKIRDKGYDIINTPAAQIQHLEGASFNENDISLNRIINTEHGREKYYSKNFKPIKRYLLNTIYYINLRFKSIFHPSSFRRRYSKYQLNGFLSVWEKTKTKH